MEAVAERQARLTALRESAQATPSGGAAASQDKQAEDVPVVRLRNYKARDESVPHERVPAAKAPELDAPSTDAHEPMTQQEVIEAYAPKKPHMDLKRDVAKRLAKLERKTQRAIWELAQELRAGDASPD